MQAKPKYILTEDWTVVVLGFLIILLSLSGLIIPVPSLKWGGIEELTQKVLSMDNLMKFVYQFLLIFFVAILGAIAMGKPIKKLFVVVPVVYALTILALVISGSAAMRSLNLEGVIFSLGIGLAISNFFKLPKWFVENLSTELFVKIGLVLLGTSVIFSDVLKAGSLGLVQALFVVLSVWYFAFWVSKKMGIDEEFAIMKRHPQIGADALASAEAQLGSNSFLRLAREISLTHHEKWDGSGYPAGLAGEAIPLSGRLMAVADVYDALISKRVYKHAFTHEEAKAIIVQGRGSHFDPGMVDAFLACEGAFRQIAAEHRDQA